MTIVINAKSARISTSAANNRITKGILEGHLHPHHKIDFVRTFDLIKEAAGHGQSDVTVVVTNPDSVELLARLLPSLGYVVSTKDQSITITW